MSNAVLLELLHHKTWATLRLVEYCQKLAPEHLDATMPGTYGSIRETFRHLFRADENYFRSLTGEDLGQFPEEAGLGALAERFKNLSKRWETVLIDPALADKEVENRWGFARGIAPLAQSIHHADDHRTHILTIIGARGLEVPDLDVWEHGTQMGFVRSKETVPSA